MTTITHSRHSTSMLHDYTLPKMETKLGEQYSTKICREIRLAVVQMCEEYGGYDGKTRGRVKVHE